jgi:hypothetical protein
VRLEELGQLKKIHLIGTRTCDLPACSIVPQPTTLPHAPSRVWSVNLEGVLDNSFVPPARLGHFLVKKTVIQSFCLYVIKRTPHGKVFQIKVVVYNRIYFYVIYILILYIM